MSEHAATIKHQQLAVEIARLLLEGTVAIQKGSTGGARAVEPEASASENTLDGRDGAGQR